MKEIQVTARCRIHEGKLAEFKTAAEKCLRSVRAKDTGTLQYDWFFNENQTECIVHERYEDSEALLKHIQNLGGAMGELLAACGLSVEIYGSPSAQLLKLSEALDVTVYLYFQGLSD